MVEPPRPMATPTCVPSMRCQAREKVWPTVVARMKTTYGASTAQYHRAPEMARPAKTASATARVACTATRRSGDGPGTPEAPPPPGLNELTDTPDSTSPPSGGKADHG